VAVNLHGKGPQSSQLLSAVGPGRMIAFANEAAGVAGPLWRDDEHEVSRWCRLVTESSGIAADPTDLRLRRPSSQPAATDAVVIHPGAAYGARRWPVERFAAVARWASTWGPPVVVTGSASESALAEQVVTSAGLPAEAVVAGKTTLLELAAVVSSARLVICGDTGIAHLATAFGRPSVVLFGPVPPDLWGPPADGPHVALWRGDVRGGSGGDPWATEPDPALLAITVEDVVAAVSALLAAECSGGGTPVDVPLERAGEAVV
jgi:ADP-heptose:LPS heptosyltransferase